MSDIKKHSNKVAATVSWGLKTLIHLYQAFRNGHPSQCRYTPSCSVYALQAIELHGPLKGVLLATKRIIRCNPWGKWGYDPVPAKNVIQAQKSEAIS